MKKKPIDIIEYLRKNGRKQGRKKGIMFCGIDPEEGNRTIIGFSVCHKTDRFDYMGCTEKKIGHGLEMAKQRAYKWADYDNFFIQTSHHEDVIFLNEDLFYYENPDPSNVVEIPPSVYPFLRKFIIRAKKYYKDKIFPVWAEDIADGELGLQALNKMPYKMICSDSDLDDDLNFLV